MVQSLRTLVALAKDPDLDPSTTICNFSSGVYDVFFLIFFFFCLLGYCMYVVHLHAGKTLLSIK